MATLTRASIDAKKPQAADRRYADGQGLYLKVAANGTKSFTYRYSYAGKRRWMHIGTYPETSLAEARVKLAEAVKLLEDGKDPGHVRAVAKAERRDSLTVTQLIEDFHLNWLKKDGGYKAPDDAKSRLERDVGRVLGKMLIVDVSPVDLTRVWNDMRDRKVGVAPKRTLALTKKMFDYAVRQHLIGASPVTMMPKDVGRKEVPVKTNLLLTQLKEVLEVLNGPNIGMHIQTRLAIKFILATAKRPGEVATLKWAHIDLKRREWLNPSDLTKEQHGDHMVFLSDYAVRVLEQLKAINPKSPYVFPSHRSDAKSPHIDPRTLSGAIRKLVKSGTMKKKWTPHDLRRTFSSRAADLEIFQYVTEKCLDHLMTGTQAVYNLGTYFKLRREAMTLWGQTLTELDPLPTIEQSMTFLRGRSMVGMDGRRDAAVKLRAAKTRWADVAKQLGYPSAAAARMACNQ